MAKLKDPPAVVLTLNSNKDNCILFWGHTKGEGTVGKECLSQWFPCKFKEPIVDNQGNTVQEVHYFCAEQYMMAHKALLFNDLESFNKIRNATTAKQCKELGRSVKGFDQKLWDEHKEEIVTVGNYHKFSQNPDLAEYLKSTEGKVLAEASPYDKIWGIGFDREHAFENRSRWGQNLLGKALMIVRENLLHPNIGDVVVIY